MLLFEIRKSWFGGAGFAGAGFALVKVPNTQQAPPTVATAVQRLHRTNEKEGNYKLI